MWEYDTPIPPNRGALEALNPDGSLKWRYYTDGWQRYPVVGPDGSIYISGYGVGLTALDPEGNVKWSYLKIPMTLNLNSLPAIGLDGLIYFCSNRDLYALNPDGTLSWKTTYGADYRHVFHFRPSIGNFGATMYLGSSHFYSMRPDGTILWQYKATEAVITNEPAVICPDGTVLFSLMNGEILALDQHAELEWTFNIDPCDFAVQYAPVVAPDGTIYAVSCFYNKLYAIDPDGTLKWVFETPSSSQRQFFTPAIGADGTIYFGNTSYGFCANPPSPKYPSPTKDAYFYALDPDGNIKWQYPLDYRVSAPAQISEDGILYFPTEGGFLYALDTGTGMGLAKTGWPGRHYDAQNTGNGSGVFLDEVKGGDFNGNGSLEITDVISLIFYSRYYSHHPALDINDDGKYNICDAVNLILSMTYIEE